MECAPDKTTISLWVNPFPANMDVRRSADAKGGGRLERTSRAFEESPSRRPDGMA
ncbi:hypothetical protein QJS04_geneDACA002756 [Acorus gramineus]|uniref:Uncharacterized protein n=1 Tax=Acorus gramineus TaxID=55184 RepID=A0AAV9BY00_ACOGR|nr:hypothetical protein QJS04_geneDACA002756 [Acorus gramineus]